MWIYMITRLDTTPKESKRARLLYLFISFILLSLTSVAAVINALGIYRVLFEVVPGESQENIDMGWGIMDRVNKELLLYGEVVWSISVFLTDAVLVRPPLPFLIPFRTFHSRFIDAIASGSTENGCLLSLLPSYS